MFQFLVPFLLFLCGVASKTTFKQQCGTHEVSTTCALPCQPTCLEPNKTCILPCTQGCICKPNYIRNVTSGSCILKTNCKGCQNNQVWLRCSDNGCEKTCDNRNITIVCPKCTSGCSCKPGYVWNQNFTECISVKSCPRGCADNQFWEQCSDNLCKKTCFNKNLNLPCPKVCIAGCSCKKDYVWNVYLTKCISVNQCPKECGPNQEWERCSDNNCRRTCDNINQTLPCITICRPGCSCKLGFVWNQNHTKCIPIDECVPVCGPNQVWEVCSDNSCKKTCANKNNTVICPAVCIAGCSCKPGYVWNDNLNDCISIDSCPQQCDDNQVWEKCSDNNCKRTCKNLNSSDVCPLVCVPGCSCTPGHVWNNKLTECVPVCYCDKKCGHNQEWSDCTSPCQRTCEGRSTVACPTVCIPGCKCIDGYLFDKFQNRCVAASNCSQRCHDNKQWCRYAPVLEVTCQKVLCPQCHRIDIFHEIVLPGCICTTGFILDELTNNCITLENCLDQLGK